MPPDIAIRCGFQLVPLEILERGEVKNVLAVPADRRPVAVNDLDQPFRLASSPTPNMCFR